MRFAILSSTTSDDPDKLSEYLNIVDSPESMFPVVYHDYVKACRQCAEFTQMLLSKKDAVHIAEFTVSHGGVETTYEIVQLQSCPANEYLKIGE